MSKKEGIKFIPKNIALILFNAVKASGFEQPTEPADESLKKRLANMSPIEREEYIKRHRDIASELDGSGGP